VSAEYNNEPKLTFLGKLFMSLLLGGLAYGAWWLFSTKQPNGSSGAPSQSSVEETLSPVKGTTVRIAYGTEKERWLKWAVQEFAKTRDGKQIQIELLPMGSIEGARAAAQSEKNIHVWSPASSAYREVFVNDWKLQHSNEPILREQVLALSPMVFVMWKERYDAFVSHYQVVDFDTISAAMNDPGGWNTIAGKPEWGFFKFGHTSPIQSNSGLLSLVLMAQHYHQKITPLEMKDIVNPEFQTWLKKLEGSVSGLIASTGNMMKDMVLKGPASYDAVFVYENVAIDYLKNAEGRWGTLQVIYPKINLWNDNPYYIIDAPWATNEVKNAAGKFLDYLMSAPVQTVSLEHGFRPGDPSVAIKGPDSPFTRYASYGIQIDVSSVAQPPRGDAINSLLTGWQRLRSN